MPKVACRGAAMSSVTPTPHPYSLAIAYTCWPGYSASDLMPALLSTFLESCEYPLATQAFVFCPFAMCLLLGGGGGAQKHLGSPIPAPHLQTCLHLHAWSVIPTREMDLS